MEFEVVDKLTASQVQSLHELYAKQWWCKEASLAEVEHLLQYSLSIALVDPVTKKLLAYSRVVSDRLKFAYIFDVMVDDAYRGKKLGKALMKAILAHPDLAKVVKFELKCLQELIPFYEKCGFSLSPPHLITMMHAPTLH